MARILALGIPIGIRKGLEKAVKANRGHLACIQCEVDRCGFYQLLPHPPAAVHHLRHFFEDDAFNTSYADALVLVFPYAEVPNEVLNELQAVEELGGSVIYVTAGADGWPKKPGRSRQKKDDGFLASVLRAAEIELFPPDANSPSEVFLSIVGECPRIIVTHRALDTCDEIAKTRIPFIREAAMACLDFVERGGDVGRIDAFFRDKGIAHAQTGGIETTLTVCRGGKCVYFAVSKTHLKDGDNTTPQAAARIYYHAFRVDSASYIAIVYAGPHISKNIGCTHELTH